ncbi:Di/tri peptide transporter 2 [Xylariales sp. AK1849]|nr:Di/tri peptide transporter 2 [Xylariales sp. AK1849]
MGESSEMKTSQTSSTQTHDAELANTPDGEIANEHEKKTLRLVSDSIPLAAWLVCIVETAERFSYYGTAGPLQNYMQNPYGSGLRPGALGLGQANASSIWYGFNLYMFVTPLIGGVIADSWLGRYRTICWGVALQLCGLLIIFLTSLPHSLEHGAGLGGLIATLFLLGTAAGGIKSNVAVLIFEQYTETKAKIRTLKSGERVIVDPQVTISNIYMVFYNLLCIGCLSGIPTTYIELRIGFWATFLLTFCVFWISVAGLALGRKKYVRNKPRPVLGKAMKALGIAVKGGFNMDAAKPSFQAQLHEARQSRSSEHIAWDWDDHFVDELKRGLYACRVFLPLPIAWLCYLQAMNNLVSQAGTMETHGLPNDILYNFQLLIEIVLIHVLRTVIYPLLRKWHIQVGPIRRITTGFAAGVLATAWAAVVQHVVYSEGPCYEYPLACAASEYGTIPNQVHVMLQFPCYVLFALSEALFSITAAEYAYTKAPTSMKSVVAALNLLTVAVASALGIAVSRAAVDPHLTIMYASLAAVYFVVTCVFYFFCQGYDKLEDEFFNLDLKE